MADLKGVNISRGSQGANVLAGGDEKSGLIIEAIAATGLVLNTVKAIYSVADAKLLGIDEAFDETNNIVAYHHISEFYRNAKAGTELFIILVARDTSMEAIFIADNTSLARKMIIEANGGIRQIAVAVNPTIADVIVDGLTDDCMAAIPLAQGFAEWAYDNFMPCQVFLEGRAYAGTASSVQNLRAITNVNAYKVSVLIGQDWNYAETLIGLQQKYADVGTMLGFAALAAVNQNIGENESFNLTDGTKGIWLVPALSNHITNKAQFSDLQTLENKGYIFGLEYTGLAGVRFNNDHVCAAIVIDAEGKINEHTIAYGRTHDKAVRLLRTAYLPKVKTTQPVVPETGLLPVGVVKYFDAIGDDVFARMVTRGEITYGKATTDANSDLIVEKILKVGFVIVPYGTVGEIQGTINLKKNI